MQFKVTHKDLRIMFFSGLSGLVLTLSFPKSGLFFLSWIAFIPLFFVIKDLSPKKGFLAGLSFGLVHFLSMLYWVVYTLHTFGFLPYILCLPILLLLALYLALYPAFFSMLLIKWCRRPALLILISPSLWVVLEFIRTYALTGFPWELLGYSQHNFTTIIQMADITGVYGLSFLVMMANTVLFTAILHLSGKSWQENPVSRKTAGTQAAVTGLCLVIALVYGHNRIKQVSSWTDKADTLTVSVIQGNIDQSVKWNEQYQTQTITKYDALSLRAAAKNPDLIVWPETAAPFYLDHGTSLARRLRNNIRQTGAPHIIGFPTYEREGTRYKFYNTAYLMGVGGDIQGSYSKVHLVPFGEYVPLQRFLPFIQKLTEQSGDFYPGRKGETVTMEKGPILGIQICFEVIFQNLCRAQVQNGSQILINITNDAWFSDSSAPYQHFSMVKFRAVENRRAIARCANTGISGFIDPTGKESDLTGLYTDAYRTRTLPLITTETVYTRYGDWIVALCAIFISASWLIGRKEKRIL